MARTTVTRTGSATTASGRASAGAPKPSFGKKLGDAGQAGQAAPSKPAATAATPTSAPTAKGRDQSAARPAPARFIGFAKDAPRFFHELAAEMNRDWFAEHKAEYEALWVAPMTALLAEVRVGLAPTYRGLTLAEPKLFRIHRDVRFAKDKTPYKTHCAGLITLGAGPAMATGAALYLQLGEGEYAGAGFYGFTPDQLVRWRQAIVADRSGRELVAALAIATQAGHTLDAQEVLVRVPRDHDPDHPRADLLRHKGCVLGFPAIPRGLIHKPDLARWLTDHATRAAPVVRWLERNVGHS